VKTLECFVRTLLVLAASLALAYASDPTAVYARVDKVVLEPTADSPERIQIWGVFAMAKPNDRNDYLVPGRGYLYFNLAANKEAARKEWADLKDLAGTGQIVGFGSRYDPPARLRRADERQANPDVYSTNMGLHKIRSNTDWPPIRALAAFRD
jgi:hypothetical protein